MTYRKTIMLLSKTNIAEMFNFLGWIDAVNIESTEKSYLAEPLCLPVGKYGAAKDNGAHAFSLATNQS